MRRGANRALGGVEEDVVTYVGQRQRGQDAPACVTLCISSAAAACPAASPVLPLPLADGAMSCRSSRTALPTAALVPLVPVYVSST